MNKKILSTIVILIILISAAGLASFGLSVKLLRNIRNVLKSKSSLIGIETKVAPN